MSKLSKIMLMVWSILALISFTSAFFAPLYFKIIGLIFGSLNIMVILTLVISYFQGIYYTKKLKEIENGMQLQEGEEVLTFFPSVPHARGGSQRGGYCRKDGDSQVQYFLPKSLVHGMMSGLWFMVSDF